MKKSGSFAESKISNKENKKRSNQKSSSKKHKKNISWGESQLIKGSKNIENEYGKRLRSFGISS